MIKYSFNKPDLNNGKTLITQGIKYHRVLYHFNLKLITDFFVLMFTWFISNVYLFFDI